MRHSNSSTAVAVKIRSSARRSSVTIGFVVGALYACSIVGLDEWDDRYGAAGVVALGAALVLFGFVSGALLLRQRRIPEFAWALGGILLGTVMIVPLDWIRVSWYRAEHRQVAEDLRRSLLLEIENGARLPTRDELASRPGWGKRLDRTWGDFHYVRRSETEFDLLVREPGDKPYGFGFHRLDSVTGSWRYDARPYVFAMIEN